MSARRTEPTRSLLQGCEYVNAASTDIRKRFEAIRAALAKPVKAPNVKTLKQWKTT